MSWYHISYDVTGTEVDPNANKKARESLLLVFQKTLVVDVAHLYRPTETSILFYSTLPYLTVYNSLKAWSDAFGIFYVLSMIAVDSQGRNCCVWNPKDALTRSIRAEYRELISNQNEAGTPFADYGRS